MTPFAKVAALAAVLLLPSLAAMAQAEHSGAEDDTDWLIARREGQWELVSRGPAGRVHKEYPNQEVLRRLEIPPLVEVVSMPRLADGEETACAPRARRDARDPCSSNFLACRTDPGLAAVGFAFFVLGATEGAADSRNRLVCRIDVDAMLRAAKEVGMIEHVPPRRDIR